MHATLPFLIKTDFPAIQRNRLETVQVNLGYKCNQNCKHCHVNAGPNRNEEMDRKTADHVIQFIKAYGIKNLDITGGAPELNPNFRHLINEAKKLGLHVIDRCNLTVLEEPGFEDMADFLADNNVEIVASLPCYLKENVDGQRGNGVYETSIKVLKKLNSLTYGKNNSGLVLNLMYNPTGPSLPPDQEKLEIDYKRELKNNFNIEFNNLYTLTNMPIMRFGNTLISKGKFNDYMSLLKSAHRDSNLKTVMCVSLISVNWQGFVYDCDFNQMLELPMKDDLQDRYHIAELNGNKLEGKSIVIGDHCYGCTAGRGSSCGGALRDSAAE
jgi:radical SAM/Cys-rich protein